MKVVQAIGTVEKQHSVSVLPLAGFSAALTSVFLLLEDSLLG